MNIFHALILGIIEGITEFLPISSTAHLIIASKYLGLAQNEFQKFFEVFIQSGAILAVLLLHTRYVLKHRSVIKKIMISFVPTAVIGLVFYKLIKSVFFESYSLIGYSLLFIGIVFLFMEYAIARDHLKLSRHIEHMSYRDALFIGIIQGLSIVPGVSRAGIVMVGMMLLRYRREEAALYSFLLAVPTIFAAAGYDFIKSRHVLVQVPQNVLPLTIGFITSFVFAYLSIYWLMEYLKKNSLSIFGFYRIALAIIVIFV